jgi:phage virion morphogenesis protein
MAVVNYGRTLVELGRMARRMGKPEGGLKRVGQYVRGLSLQAFRESKDPNTGDPWWPLLPSTIKGRRGKRAQILVDTSGLRRSIVAKITGRNRIAVGTSKKYGIYHQLGSSDTVTSSRSGGVNVGRLPARPFLGFDKRGEKEISRIMKDFILGKK